MFPRIATKWNKTDQVTIKQKRVPLRVCKENNSFTFKKFEKIKTIGPENV